MTVKVLVTALGQQLIADTKQIENKESKDLVGYWLNNPRVVAYSQNEESGVSVNFASYCLVSDEQAFSIRSEHIVAILEPRADVIAAYEELVAPAEDAEVSVEGEEPTETETNDGTDTADTEATLDDTSVTDGTDGDGTSVPS